jgi:hypothetical protein
MARMRQTSANHHYVPQAILRNFSFDGETVFYFTKRAPQRGVETRNVQSIFKRRHLNSTISQDGSRSDHLEEFYSTEFDDKIVSFLSKYGSVAASQSEVRVSDTDKRFFVQFLYNLMKRTPEFHEVANIAGKLDEMVPVAIRDYEREFGKLPESEQRNINDPKVRERIIQNARVDVLARQSDSILELMASREVCFARPIRSAKSFVIGSNPVVRMTNNRDMRLDIGDVELWAPFSPSLAIGLLTPRHRNNVFQLDDTFVRHFNRSVLLESLAVAARSRELLESLLKHR